MCDDRSLDVFTVGEPLITIAPERARSLADTDLLRKSVSGAEANTAVGLARLGCRVALGGLVGDDAFGMQIRAELAHEGVDVEGLRAVAGRTGVIVKQRPSEHHAISRYYRAGCVGAGLGIEHIDLSQVETAQRLHLTGITCALGQRPRELVRRLVDIASRVATIVSFDPNMRPALWDLDDARLEFRRVLPDVDELLCNEHEAELLVGVCDTDGALDRLRELGPRTIVIKRGAAGVSALIDGQKFHVPAFPAPAPRDPTGAGDAFNAGWLFGRLHHFAPAPNLAIAAWVASQVVQSEHDWAAFPTLDEWASWSATSG